MSQCGFELRDQWEWWQVQNNCHLCGIDQDPIVTYYMAQKYTKWCTKYSFSQIQHILILSTPFQHHPQILNMVSHQTKDHPITKIYFKKPMNEIFKIRNYYFRENSRGVFKAKGHYCVLVASPFCYEGCLVTILWCNSGLMVA